MTKRFGIAEFFLLAVTILGVCFSLQTRLAEDALDMLPGDSLRGDLELLQQLGMVNRIFISLEYDPGDQGHEKEGSGGNSVLLESSRLLGERLAASPLFREVFFRLPQGYEFQLASGLQDHIPILIDAEDLIKIEEKISPENLRKSLKENYLKLNTPEGLLMVNHIRRDPLGFSMIILEKLKSLRGGMKMEVNDGFFVSADGHHCLLWAESVGSLTSSVTASQVKEEIDSAISKSLQPGVKAAIVGPLPHTLANSSTIRRDLGRLLPIAGLALLVILLSSMRNWRALLVVSIPFLAVPPAIALISFLYGTVSAMALGFGIVLLGIGVDFAVHIYLGSNDEGEIPAALKKTLSMAFLTTISVFTVLLFSTVPAHRQMALLAIAGLSWSLVMAWRLVPALVSGKGRGDAKELAVVSRNILLQGEKGLLLKVGCWLCLITAGIVVWPLLHYDGDLRSLDVPSASVKSDERDFIRTWGQEEQAFVVAEAYGQGEVFDLNDRVYGMLAAEGVPPGIQSLSPVLPGPVSQKENIFSWKRLWDERLVILEDDLSKAALEAGFTADAFQPFIDSLAVEPEKLVPRKLLAGPLRPFISSLFRKIPAMDGEPAVFLAATMVPDTALNQDFLRKAEAELPGVTVISNSRWRHRVEEYLKADIVKLSAIAGLLVIMVCAVFLRHLSAVIAALAPVLSALSAMSLYSFFADNSLNIMHLLMGIMVIGLSVDYGIFIVRACGERMDSITFSAVSICALSTLSGFGVLAFAEHPALSALGITVLVGIGAAWPTALFFTPALINFNRRGYLR